MVENFDARFLKQRPQFNDKTMYDAVVILDRIVSALASPWLADKEVCELVLPELHELRRQHAEDDEHTEVAIIDGFIKLIQEEMDDFSYRYKPAGTTRAEQQDPAIPCSESRK